MFKKFILGFAAVAMIAQPAFAGKYGGGSSYSSSSNSRSYSSGSSYRPSSSYSSYRAPAAAPATSPRFSSGAGYNYKPAQTQVVTRPSGGYYGSSYRSGPVVQNHYYGGSYGGGGGGILSNPFFWMWAMEHHNQAPVYVNGGQPGGMAQGGATGNYGPAPVDNGPGFFGMIFWGIINLLLLVGFVILVIWGVRKLIVFFRK